MGYAGGGKKNPTYHALGDHSETVQIDFDPQQISYNELLDVFWDSHEPDSPPYSRQYMSIIFYHNGEQKQLAFQSKELKQQVKNRKVFTDIIPASVFYIAESYHQKYYLRGVPGLMKEFSKMYPVDKDFVDSTAAARVNGYLAGYGSLSHLESELDSLGLSPVGNKRLLETVQSRHIEEVVSHRS